MRDFGIVRPGTTLYIPFATYDSNDPSASVTLTGLATSDVEIYKDGSVTQRGSDAGYTLLDTDGIDFDGVTGIHGISIDLADNTTAGFYAAGSQYWVVVASITVDAATVNFIAATFRIGYPAALLNTTIATLASQTSFTLTSGPAEDDALNGMEVVIHDVASAVQMGRAVILDYTGSTKTVTLAAGTTFTAAATDNIAIIGPSPLQPTVAARTLDVTATGAAGIDWGNIENQGASVGLTTTTVNAIAAAVTATLANGAHGGASASFEFGDGGTIGSIGATSGGLQIIGGDGSNPAVAITNLSGAAVVATGAVTISGTLSATTNSLPWNASWDAEVQSEADDALAARGVTSTRMGYVDNLSAGAVATAAKLLSYVQSMLRSDVTVDADIGGTYDDATDSQQAIRDRGDAAWTTATGFSTHSAADVWAAATRTLSSAGVQAIWDAATSALTTAGSIGKRIVDYLTGDVFARLGAPAGVSTAADIAAVKTQTAAIETDTQDLQSRTPASLTGAGNMKVDALAINGSTGAAANLAKTTAVIGRGTATTGGTTTSIPTSAFSPAGAVADQFVGRIVTFDSDTTTAALRGQSTAITASSNSATPTLTVTALTTAPASGDTFSVT